MSHLSERTPLAKQTQSGQGRKDCSLGALRTISGSIEGSMLWRHRAFVLSGDSGDASAGALLITTRALPSRPVPLDIGHCVMSENAMGTRPQRTRCE